MEPRAAAAAPPLDMLRARSALMWILLAAFVVRLALVAWLHTEPLHIHDERDYDLLATNLLRHGEFSHEVGQPISLRPPLYPAVVSAIYGIAGEANYTAVRLVQCFLAVATAALVYVLASRLYDRRTGLVAAGICAFYPSLLVATGFVLTETLFTLLVVSACLLMHLYLERPGVMRITAFGAVLALAALTRSVLWLFPPVFMLFVLALSPAKPGRRLLHALAGALAFAAVIGPWAYRNTRLQNTFIAVDVMGGRNFMMGNYEHTPMDRPWDAIGMTGDKSWHALLKAKIPAGEYPRTQGQVDKAALKYGLRYVVAHPGQTAARCVAKFFDFWQLERETIALLSRGHWGNIGKISLGVVAAWILAAYVATILLGIFGWMVRPPSWTASHWFLFLVVTFVCGIHTLVFGHSRYHLPLMPLLGVYAAAAYVGLGEIRSQWKSPAFLGAALVSLALAVSWCIELVYELGRL